MHEKEVSHNDRTVILHGCRNTSKESPQDIKAEVSFLANEERKICGDQNEAGQGELWFNDMSQSDGQG